MQYLLLPRRRAGARPDPWTPGLNTCNSCDPALPDTIYATGSGFTEDWTEANGVHTLEWVYGCSWQELMGGAVPPWGSGTYQMELYYYGGYTGWGINYYPDNGWQYGLLKRSSLPSNPNCDPRGTYNTDAGSAGEPQAGNTGTFSVSYS